MFHTSTLETWQSFQQWKYEEGFLVNMGTKKVLTETNKGLVLSGKLGNQPDPSQQWTLDYNGKLVWSPQKKYISRITYKTRLVNEVNEA